MTWKTSTEKVGERNVANWKELSAALRSTVPEPWKVAAIASDACTMIKARCEELQLHPHVAPAFTALLVAEGLLAQKQAWFMDCLRQSCTTQWDDEAQEFAAELAEAWTTDLQNGSKKTLKELRDKLFGDLVAWQEKKAKAKDA